MASIDGGREPPGLELYLVPAAVLALHLGSHFIFTASQLASHLDTWTPDIRSPICQMKMITFREIKLDVLHLGSLLLLLFFKEADIN